MGTYFHKRDEVSPVIIKCEWAMCSDSGKGIDIDGKTLYLCIVHRVLVMKMLARRDSLVRNLEYIRKGVITHAITKECWREIR